MKPLFKPDKYYRTAFDIDFEKLIQEGKKVIAFDLDNTLVPHFVKDPDDKVMQLLTKVQKLGFEFVVISNNNYGRVKRFCEPLGIKYYYGAKKPLKFTFKRILDDYNITKNELVIVGDQIMTDVFGASRMGITSIFVEPLAKKDIIYTKINRQMERVLLKRLERKGLFKTGEYYD